jgi:hypothetical protein
MNRSRITKPAKNVMSAAERHTSDRQTMKLLLAVAESANIIMTCRRLPVTVDAPILPLGHLYMLGVAISAVK